MLSRVGSIIKIGGIGTLIYFGYKMVTGLYDAVMEDPATAAAAGINPKEVQELKQLTEQLTQLVGDGKDLPPEVQEKYTAIQARIVKLGERFTLEQQAREQNRKAREKN
jgi:Zn-dependent oligopeptidase